MAMPSEASLDLQSQLEDLFHSVWEQEKLWRVEDRLDGLIRLTARAVEAGPPKTRPAASSRGSAYDGSR